MRPQAIKLLQLLIEEGRPMTARQIAGRMNMSSRNVYRLTKRLKAMNLILSGPVVEQVFCARQQAHAISAYVPYSRLEFDSLFGEAYRQGAKNQAARRAELTQRRNSLSGGGLY
jgi:predicted DNA-binding transcriptional regulator YafY